MSQDDRTKAYEIGSYGLEIEEFEVESQTEHFLKIWKREWAPKGKEGKRYLRRVARFSDGSRFYRSWEEARSALREREQGKVEYHRKQAAEHSANVMQILDMVDPTKAVSNA